MKEQNRWFEFADEDYIVAQASLERKIYNQVCFHSHQGIEKLLKGYLFTKNKNIPRTHFIGVLLKLCVKINKKFSEMIDRCIKLDDYYIPTRYPDALPGSLPDGLPAKEDAEESLSILEEMRDLIKNNL